MSHRHIHKLFKFGHSRTFVVLTNSFRDPTNKMTSNFSREVFFVSQEPMLQLLEVHRKGYLK